MNRVVVVGPFPPPVHGAAVMTEAVTERLCAAGAAVTRCNISPTAKTRGWRWHLSRMRAYGRCYAQILGMSKNATLYISLSGGAGLAYDLIGVMLARWKASTVVFHHHSFNYVDRWRLIFALLLRVGAANQVHAVLCGEMERKMRVQYACVRKFVQVSNGGILRLEARCTRERYELRNIGFLSNLAMTKGVDRFLDLAAALAADAGLKAHVAGPFADAQTQAYVESRLKSLPNVTYHGPLYGEDKQRFYDRIDFFVFLSRYPNEAEPLVVYEAMAAGLPVAVTGRGCLCELVGSAVMVDREGQDLAPIIQQIASWRADPEAYRSASLASAERFRALRRAWKTQAETFLGVFGLVAVRRHPR